MAFAWCNIGPCADCGKPATKKQAVGPVGAPYIPVCDPCGDARFIMYRDAGRRESDARAEASTRYRRHGGHASRFHGR